MTSNENSDCVTRIKPITSFSLCGKSNKCTLTTVEWLLTSAYHISTQYINFQTAALYIKIEVAGSSRHWYPSSKLHGNAFRKYIMLLTVWELQILSILVCVCCAFPKIFHNYYSLPCQSTQGQPPFFEIGEVVRVNTLFIKWNKW